MCVDMQDEVGRAGQLSVAVKLKPGRPLPSLSLGLSLSLSLTLSVPMNLVRGDESSRFKWVIYSAASKLLLLEAK